MAIEERIEGETENMDVIDLHELESTLVYFATSLRANGVVLDRLTRYKRLEQYPEDQELLIQGFSDNELKEVLDELYVDDLSRYHQQYP